jgi:SAM-dependent methyltransferase
MSMLKELLNVYWLRPETALWRALDIETMKDFEITGRSLDLGCGDGVLSFIRGGGQFDISFDDYQSIGNLDKFYKNKDIHDVFIEGYRPVITHGSKYNFSAGLDHKENLLLKAEALDLYKETIVHDANKALPIEDNKFDTIFSNIVYWLNDPQKSINEIARVMSSGGKVALMLPNITMPEFSFYNNHFIKTEDRRYEFLKLMDRGRYSSNIKVAKSYGEWKELFGNSGLKIVDHKMHLSKTVIEIWDIGLRPLFPVLHKMVNAIEDKDKLIDVKREWIDIFMQFLEPIFNLEMDGLLDQNAEKAFHYFVLEK